VFGSEDEGKRNVAAWLLARVTDGIRPHEFGGFVRGQAELARATAAVGEAGLPFRILDDDRGLDCGCRGCAGAIRVAVARTRGRRETVRSCAPSRAVDQALHNRGNARQ
jgi:hypothetical protein